MNKSEENYLHKIENERLNEYALGKRDRKNNNEYFAF